MKRWKSSQRALLAATLVASFGLAGCLSLAYAPKHRKIMNEERRAHYYSFYLEQTQEISEAYGCKEGADYFLGTMRSRFNRDLDEKDIEVLREKIEQDGLEWVKACVEREHAMLLANQWLIFSRDKKNQKLLERTGFPSAAQRGAISSEIATMVAPIHEARQTHVYMELDRGHPRAGAVAKSVEGSYGSKPVSFVKTKGEANIGVSIKIGTPTYDRGTTTVTRSHRYVSGTKTIANPDIPNLKRKIEDEQKRIDVSMRSANPNHAGVIDSARRNIENYRDQLSKAKPTKVVNTYSDYTYPAKQTTYYAMVPVEFFVMGEGGKPLRQKGQMKISTSRLRYPGNPKVKLPGSNPPDPTEAELNSLLDARGAGIINNFISKAAVARFDNMRAEVVKLPAGPKRQGMMMRWLMHMPSSTERVAARGNLPGELEKEAKMLEEDVKRMLEKSLLDPSASSSSGDVEKK